MKLIAVGRARCVWVFDTRLLTKGRSFLDAMYGIRDRYRFARAPQHVMDFNKDGAMEFLGGSYRTNDGTVILVDLSLYNNGFIADTHRSSDESEEFMQDVMAWLGKEHNFTLEPSTTIHKFYDSQLEVQSKSSLDFLNPKLQALTQKISAQSSSINGKPRHYQVANLAFWPEDAGKPEAPAPFRVERKWGTDYKDNVYFAEAPLRTQDHISALEGLEGILTPAS